jgi:Cytochrome c554 and c-prime
LHGLRAAFGAAREVPMRKAHRTLGVRRLASIVRGLATVEFLVILVLAVSVSAAPVTPTAAEADAQQKANEAHEKVFLANRFPPATACRTCHPTQFEQWSVSQHAYAQMSPVFNAFHGTLLQLTNGTNGDFCIRCHTPIGMNLGEPLYMSNMDRDPAAREGITCVACHRVSKAYGKISGRLALVEGSIFAPVYGPTGDAELKRVLSEPEKYRVVTDPKQQGRAIHRDVVKFFQLVEPGFCGTCHDVTLVNGFRLEEAFSEYKTSPAAKRGVTCQDCHMGKEPGKPSGYNEGPAAIVGGVPTRTRKLTDHRFAGPDYSVIHPALFPFNERAQKLATMREWLQFDWKAGWGTDAFENKVPANYKFPKHWESVDDRYDAHDIIEANLKKLAEMAELRKKVLQNGYQFGDVRVTRADAKGIEVEVQVKNATDGHNVPTGFTGERLVWLHAVVTDSDGKVVFESGDLDPNGDLRDAHSLYVHDGRLPRDKQLFSLQSKFVVANIRGGEREQVLAVNYSLDPLPFLRPDSLPTFLKGRITSARIHKETIPPLGHRDHRYEIPASKLTGRGPYHVKIELKAAMIPVNLIAAIKDAGIDYYMSPAELARNVVAGHQVLWTRELTADTHAAGSEAAGKGHQP